MSNELSLSLAISGAKTGALSAGVGRGIAGLLANMNALLVQGPSSILANHLGNGAISGATNAFPIVLTTSVAHGLTSGESVVIASVGGNTNANGTWTATVLSTTTFSIPTVGNAAYTSGGTWRTDPTLVPLGQVISPHYAWFSSQDPTNSAYVQNGNLSVGSISGATNANPIVITTAKAHGIASGQTPTVVISGVLGNTAANGTFTLTQLSTTTFSIPIAGNGAYTSGGIYQLSPPYTCAFLQPGSPAEAGIVPLDPLAGLAGLYAWCPVAAVQLEYDIYSQ